MHRTTIQLLLLAALLCSVPACGGGGGGGGGGDPAPVGQTLLSVSPDSGTTAGGTVVTLRGTGFLDPVQRIRRITFGGRLADDWEILDDETIVVTSPPGLPGETVINLVGDNAPYRDGILLTRGFAYRAALIYIAEDARAVQPRLFVVDLDTGGLQLIGPIGFAIEGMAMGTDRMLYGVEDGPLRRLIRMDPRVGAGAPVALLREAGSQEPVEVLDVTFHDDRLLGRTAEHELVEIDTRLGVVTPLADLGATPPGRGLAGLGPTSLYLSADGGSARLHVHDVPGGTTVPGLQLVPAYILEALASLGTDLYAIDGDPAVPGEVSLLVVDPSTGSVVPVASLPAAASAVAGDL